MEANTMMATVIVVNIKRAMERNEGYDAELALIEQHSTMKDMGVEMLLSEIEMADSIEGLQVAIDMLEVELNVTYHHLS